MAFTDVNTEQELRDELSAGNGDLRIADTFMVDSTIDLDQYPVSTVRLRAGGPHAGSHMLRNFDIGELWVGTDAYTVDWRGLTMLDESGLSNSDPMIQLDDVTGSMRLMDVIQTDGDGYVLGAIQAVDFTMENCRVHDDPGKRGLVIDNASNVKVIAGTYEQCERAIHWNAGDGVIKGVHFERQEGSEWGIDVADATDLLIESNYFFDSHIRLQSGTTGITVAHNIHWEFSSIQDNGSNNVFENTAGGTPENTDCEQ